MQGVVRVQDSSAAKKNHTVLIVVQWDAVKVNRMRLLRDSRIEGEGVSGGILVWQATVRLKTVIVVIFQDFLPVPGCNITKCPH